MDPLQEILGGLGRGMTPAGVGEKIAPTVDPMIGQLQQLIMKLFGAGAPEQDPNAGLVNDPLSGGPMSGSPLRQRMTRGRLPGSTGQDPSMGMGY